MLKRINIYILLIPLILLLLLSSGCVKKVEEVILGKEEEQTSEETKNENIETEIKKEDLSPEVIDFIADTYLSHIAEHPDPNEPVELLKLYLEGQELLRHNKIDEATTLFNKAIKEFPKCRHAHAGLAHAMRQRYEKTKDTEDLKIATHKFLEAARIGMKFGTVRYTYHIAVGLAKLEDKATLNKFFEQALVFEDRRYLSCLDYARGLNMLGDPKAEDLFKKAMELRPGENEEARGYYAEWLLDHNREAEVLNIIDSDKDIEYMQFLRGVALEKLGRLDEARKAYEIFIPYSQYEPAPEKYRIKGSKVQEGIFFGVYFEDS